MEELHKAACAYYNNSTREVQELAYNFFVAMDTDGDARVSRSELMEFLYHSGYGSWLNMHWNDVFSELDRNADNSLDFWEVLTLYYMVKTRDLTCQSCHVCLKGLYFTCVTCFDAPEGYPTYDLCSDCYSRKYYSHSHTRFLDNYALLRLKRPPSSACSYACPQNNDQALIAHPPARNFSWWDALRKLEIGIGIAAGGIACGVTCTIM